MSKMSSIVCSARFVLGSSQAEAAAEDEIDVISLALARIAHDRPRELTACSAIFAPRK
jgi:hypothetical protein